MNKLEFASALGTRLAGFPKREAEERISFYLEMIDDRIEEGLSEVDAVCAVGTVESVAAEIIGEIPLGAVLRERAKPTHRLTWWEVTLIVLGFPVWFSLLAALFAVCVSLFATLWSLVISVFAVFFSFCGGALCGVAAASVLFFVGDPLAALVMLGAALTSAGLAIFSFFGARAATKGALWLSARMLYCIKLCFVRRRDRV